MNRSNNGKARPKTSNKGLLNSLLSQIKAAKGSPQRASQSIQQPKKKGYAPGLLSKIGAVVGGFGGGPIGAKLGQQAGNWLGKITGMGSYKVNRNSLTGNSVPQFSQRLLTGGAIEICHREFIQDVQSSVAFTNTSFSINPGVSATFPFLSQIAINFEQYELLGLIFEFKTTSATAVASTNTALGVVIASTNYDVLDANFTSKQQMEAYEYTVSTVPCNSVIHPVECDPRQNTLKTMYVRTNAVPSGADARFYDLGNFQLATVGSQAAATVGELWVSYHVRLLKPKLSTPTGVTLPQAHIVESPANSATAASPLGTGGGAARYGATIPVTYANNNIFLLANGTYAITMTFYGSVAGSPAITLGSNCTYSRTILSENTTGHMVAYSGNVGIWTGIVNNTITGSNVNSYLSIGGLSGFTAGTTDIIITQVSDGIL